MDIPIFCPVWKYHIGRMVVFGPLFGIRIVSSAAVALGTL